MRLIAEQLASPAQQRQDWVKRTDWQWRAGGGRQTVSHYERVPAQRSALLKKYIRQPHVRDFAC